MGRLACAPLAILIACTEGDGAAPAMPPAPVRLPCALAADEGRAHGFRMTLEAALDRAAAAGPHAVAALFAEAPGALDDLFGLATRRDPVRIDTVVTCPDASFLLGDAVVTDLVVGLATAIDDGDGDELRAVVLRGVFADWSDGWRIHLTPPRDAFDGMRVLATTAEVRAAIARRWAAVDVTLDALGADGRLVLAAPPIEAAVVERAAPLHSGFRLVAATVDGRRADVVLGAGGYLVVGGLGRGVHRIRLRYEGPLPLVGENQASARALELHGWLPRVPFAPPGRVDLTVHHPADEALVVSLAHARPARRPAADGWRAARFVGVTDRDPSILLLDRAPAARTWEDGAGARIELLADPPVPVDGCAPALARIVRALAPLGEIGRVRIVAVPAVYGRHGRRVDDLVELLDDRLIALCAPDPGGASAEVRRGRAEAVALLAHELAHGWFGRDVRAADDEASAWWEAVAEYVSTWPLDELSALEVRRGWADDYAESAHRDLVAMAQRLPTAGAVRDVLSYDKGALLLIALEDRIGRDRVAAVLRRLIAERRGAVGSWLDVVAATQAVAGSSAARWLHGWLSAIGAPALSIDDVRPGAGRLSFAIAQDAAPPFEATVDVAVLDAAGGLLVHARVALSGGRTPVTLAVPAGAARIVVDPWYRLPRFGVAEAPVSRR